MIERSGEIIQLKQRLHSLSQQRFSGEVDGALMLDTLRSLLQRQTGEEVRVDEPPLAKTTDLTAQGETAADDDIGPLTKGILVGIMLISVGMIVLGLMQG